MNDKQKLHYVKLRLQEMKLLEKGIATTTERFFAIIFEVDGLIEFLNEEQQNEEAK